MPTTRVKNVARHMRKTHTTLKSVVPTVTAAVGLLGAIAVAMEGLSGGKTETHRPKPSKPVKADEDDEDANDEDDDDEEEETVNTHLAYSPLNHAITLLHHAIKAVAFCLILGTVVMVAFLWQPPMVLAVLVVVILWLSEIASRRAS